eukprot:jgi/Bigna1/89138/estExt_fgenesh1_pg.C_440076
MFVKVFVDGTQKLHQEIGVRAWNLSKLSFGGDVGHSSGLCSSSRHLFAPRNGHHRCAGFFAGIIARAAFWSQKSLDEMQASSQFAFEKDTFKRSSSISAGSRALLPSLSKGISMLLHPSDDSGVRGQDEHIGRRCSSSSSSPAGFFGLYLLGHLRSFPGVNSISPIIQATSADDTIPIVSISVPEHTQVIPKTAGREYDQGRVNEDDDLKQALESITASSVQTLRHWGIRTFGPVAAAASPPQACNLIVSAHVTPEKEREQHYRDIMRKIPPLPESDKEKTYIFRLFSSRLLLLRGAHEDALRLYKELHGSEMPKAAPIIVSRPDINVGSMSAGFLQYLQKTLEANPDTIVTAYPKMWLSNDQFFATSRAVIDEILSVDYACVTKHTFMRFYAEINLLMLFELVVGTSNVLITEGGFHNFEINRGCPNYKDVQGNLHRVFPKDWLPSSSSSSSSSSSRSAPSKKIWGESSGESVNRLDWNHVALAKAACGGSSPKCPPPFEKGRFPFVAKKIMRMYIQNRNDTYATWSSKERKYLMHHCKLET